MRRVKSQLPLQSDIIETISVVLCTYNGEKFLREQLESILDQSCLPHEMIVCDDCSSDSTVAILKVFASTAPFKVKVVENVKNIGSTRNFEQGILLCNSTLIALCDQDDIWYSQKLETLQKVFALNNRLTAVFSDANLIDADGNRLNRRLWESVGFQRKRQQQFLRDSSLTALLRGCIVTGATLMFRSSLRKLIMPISSLWVHDAWIAFIAAIDEGIGFVDQPLIGYRLHTGQQIGVLTSTQVTIDIRKRFKEAQEMLILLTFLKAENIPGCTHEQLHRVEEKALHLNKRARMPRSYLARLVAVCGQKSNYRKYSNGYKSMIKDFVMHKG